jgi:hypothetical protein
LWRLVVAWPSRKELELQSKKDDVVQAVLLLVKEVQGLRADLAEERKTEAKRRGK